MAAVYYVKRFKAIIVAHGRTQALEYLARELKIDKNFTLTYRDINPSEFVQLDTRLPHVVLLDAGEIL